MFSKYHPIERLHEYTQTNSYSITYTKHDDNVPIYTTYVCLYPKKQYNIYAYIGGDVFIHKYTHPNQYTEIRDDMILR